MPVKKTEETARAGDRIEKKEYSGTPEGSEDAKAIRAM